MANRTLDLLVKLTGTEKVNQQLKQVEATGTKSAKEVREAFGEAVPVFGGLNQQVTNFMSAVKALPPNLAVAGLAIAGLAMQVKVLSAAFRELDAASARVGVMRQTQRLAGGGMAATQELQDLQRLEGRTLTMQQMAQLRNQSVTRGIDLATFKEIVATADELATVTGRDLIPTIELLNQAVGTGTVRAFASAGADVRQLIAEFGEGRLTIEETRQVMQRLRDQVDGSGDSVSDAMNSMKRASTDAWQAMLNTWAENPVIIVGMTALAKATDFITDGFVKMHTQIQEAYRALQKLLGLQAQSEAAGGSTGGRGPRRPLGDKARGYIPIMQEDGSTIWVKDDNINNAPTGTDKMYVPGRGWVDTAQLRREEAAGRSRSGAPRLTGASPVEERLRNYGGVASLLGFWEAEMERQAVTRTPRQAGRRFYAAQQAFFEQQSRDLRNALPKIPPPPLPVQPRPNGGGTNQDEIAQLLMAGMQGGAPGFIGTGLGMVAANTLSAASLLGSAGGPVGMALGSLVGSLFQKRQRETIRGPVAVEDRRTHDILGALNSTMNELIRLSTAGGADRLFADAARQAVAL